MKRPKIFHPILGVLTGAILFAVGIALLSVAFVGAVKAVEYAKPYVLEAASSIHQHLTFLYEWLQH